MAHVERRQQSAGGRVSWRVWWRDPDGAERSRSFPRAGAEPHRGAALRPAWHQHTGCRAMGTPPWFPELRMGSARALWY